MPPLNQARGGPGPPIVARLRSRGLLYLLQQLIRGPHFSYPFIKTWWCTLLFEFKCLEHGGYLNFTYFREKSSELGFFPRTWHSVWNFCFQAPCIWFLYNVHCAIFHLLVKSSLGFAIKCNWFFLIEFFLIDWFCLGLNYGRQSSVLRCHQVQLIWVNLAKHPKRKGKIRKNNSKI